MKVFRRRRLNYYMRSKGYFVKNIANKDVSISDLRCVVFKGQVRNLLTRASRITLDDIKKSKESGSLSRLLGKTLIEVSGHRRVTFPKITEAKINNNRNRVAKTLQKNENAEFEDRMAEISLTEDEELIKELELEDSGSDDSPTILKE